MKSVKYCNVLQQAWKQLIVFSHVTDSKTWRAKHPKNCCTSVSILWCPFRVSVKMTIFGYAIERKSMPSKIKCSSCRITDLMLQKTSLIPWLLRAYKEKKKHGVTTIMPWPQSYWEPVEHPWNEDLWGWAAVFLQTTALGGNTAILKWNTSRNYTWTYKFNGWENC